MKKKIKKRYFTKQQIIDEIDRYKAKALKHTNAAEALEIKAARMADNPLAVETVAFTRAMAGKARASARRIYDHRLPFLKEKLSEFMTAQLPGVDNGDPSISAS